MVDDLLTELQRHYVSEPNAMANVPKLVIMQEHGKTMVNFELVSSNDVRTEVLRNLKLQDDTTLNIWSGNHVHETSNWFLYQFTYGMSGESRWMIECRGVKHDCDQYYANGTYEQQTPPRRGWRCRTEAVINWQKGKGQGLCKSGKTPLATFVLEYDDVNE